MKKIVTILMILGMILSVVACAPAAAPAEPAAEATEAPVAEATEAPVVEATEAPVVLNIAMVTDVGNIDDKSFNEFTWMGCKNWAEENGAVANYYRPSEDSDEARIETIKTAIEKGANVIVV